MRELFAMLVRRAPVAASLLSAVAGPALAAAQQPAEPPPVALGSRVRVRVTWPTDRGRSVVGVLERATAESLWVRPASRDTAVRAVARSDVDLLERSRGRRSRREVFLRSLATGAAVGAVLFAIPEPNPDPLVGPGSRAEAVVLGVLVGGAAGALVGLSWPLREVWQRVGLPPPS
jgi:hypothetical protein